MANLVGEMVDSIGTALFVGATGSIGRLAVAEAARAGFQTRALVRSPDSAASFPRGTEVVVGHLTRVDTLAQVVDGVAAVVFTHGSHGSAGEAELVDYGAVRNVLEALDGPARVALMTAIGVTKHTPGHDWKRRGERLVRASGLPYTIVRPGWFDYNEPDQHRLVMLQGDTRWAGDPSDGVISREQIAQVLVASLTCDAANRKTLELVAERGPAPADLEPLFSVLRPDPEALLDAVLDRDNLPLSQEPPSFVKDLDAVRGRF